MIKLAEAVELAVNGANAPDTNVDGHTFSIRSVRNKNLLDGDETSYFRHVHSGKDDRVFYSVQLQSDKKYAAKITRIQFRGPFVKNGFRPLGDTGIDVTDAVKLAAAAVASAGAGWVHPQSSLEPKAFAAFLTKLRSQHAQLQQAAAAALGQGIPEAARRLADLTEKIAGKKIT